MFRFKILLLTVLVTSLDWTVITSDADAGLLRNWLNRRRCCSQTSVPVANWNQAALLPGQCQTTCEQTCSRVVVNYVPTTSFRTVCERVPVTQFRPQTTTDPCTGCTVTCMRPCTTFTFQARRVPYTTFRPVYRTETFRVPVTTITNDCNTCAFPVANNCATCTTGFAPLGSVSSMNSGMVVPGGTIMTDGTFGVPATSPGTTITPLPTPSADTIPSINPQDANRSVIESFNSGSSTRIPTPSTDLRAWNLTANQRSTANQGWTDLPVASVARDSPVTRKWTYTPTKKSTYVSLSHSESEGASSEPQTIRGHFKLPQSNQDQVPSRSVNDGWETVEW